MAMSHPKAATVQDARVPDFPCWSTQTIFAMCIHVRHASHAGFFRADVFDIYSPSIIGTPPVHPRRRHAFLRGEFLETQSALLESRDTAEPLLLHRRHLNLRRHCYDGSCAYDRRCSPYGYTSVDTATTEVVLGIDAVGRTDTLPGREHQPLTVILIFRYPRYS
jgi:hypothetical protein